MDSNADLTALIRNQVKEQRQNSQGLQLDKLDELISVKLNSFNQQINENQRKLSDVQVAKLEQINNEKHKFNKKGNEEQYKINAKVQEKLQEADAMLKEDPRIRQMTIKAQEKIEEGIELVINRQKLIKIADSSEFGWRTVMEYQTNAIADNSEDERKIWKAETRAQKKLRQKTRWQCSHGRSRPYNT